MAKFFLALCGLLVIAVLKWLIDHFLYDWLVKTLENAFDLGEADVIAAVSSFVFPALIGGGAIIVAYRLGVHQGTSPAVPYLSTSVAALSLPKMQITEIAVYLRDQSAWGWRKREELNLKVFVQNAVPDELRRAARSGSVRFIGTNPNSAEAHEINLGYWDAATFDGDRIWDGRNEFFTTTDSIMTRYRSSSSGRGLYHYRFGRAPRDDVMKTWGPASVVLRMRVKATLLLRRARHGFPATMRD